MSEPVHTSCQHVAYRMSCAEFDELYAHAGGACQICQTPEVETARGRLVIDHASEYGFAVRGLLCDKCNALMRRVDNRERYDKRAQEYRYNAWFLRSRVPDELWHAAQAAAAQQGTTVSVVIREALERLALSAVGRRVNESAPRPRERPRG